MSITHKFLDQDVGLLLAEAVISDRLVALNADFRRWNHSSRVVDRA